MYILIDSPITPYSKKEEIEEWIEELNNKEQTPEVLEEIKIAREILFDNDRKKLVDLQPK